MPCFCMVRKESMSFLLWVQLRTWPILLNSATRHPECPCSCFWFRLLAYVNMAWSKEVVLSLIFSLPFATVNTLRKMIQLYYCSSGKGFREDYPVSKSNQQLEAWSSYSATTCTGINSRKVGNGITQDLEAPFQASVNIHFLGMYLPRVVSDLFQLSCLHDLIREHFTNLSSEHQVVSDIYPDNEAAIQINC